MHAFSEPIKDSGEETTEEKKIKENGTDSKEESTPTKSSPDSKNNEDSTIATNDDEDEESKKVEEEVDEAMFLVDNNNPEVEEHCELLFAPKCLVLLSRVLDFRVLKVGFIDI